MFVYNGLATEYFDTEKKESDSRFVQCGMEQAEICKYLGL